MYCKMHRLITEFLHSTKPAILYACLFVGRGLHSLPNAHVQTDVEAVLPLHSLQNPPPAPRAKPDRTTGGLARAQFSVLREYRFMFTKHYSLWQKILFLIFSQTRAPFYPIFLDPSMLYFKIQVCMERCIFIYFLFCFVCFTLHVCILNAPDVYPIH